MHLQNRIKLHTGSRGFLVRVRDSNREGPRPRRTNTIKEVRSDGEMNQEGRTPTGHSATTIMLALSAMVDRPFFVRRGKKPVCATRLPTTEDPIPL